MPISVAGSQNQPEPGQQALGEPGQLGVAGTGDHVQHRGQPGRRTAGDRPQIGGRRKVHPHLPTPDTVHIVSILQ
jgi:hypothetical protein